MSSKVRGLPAACLSGRQGRQGFTIIEVIIVMAVAGLIMALVLAVVPQASRNQRDNSRKALAQRLMSSLENYNANNQGTYPFSGPGAVGSDPPNTTWTDAATNCATINSFSQTCYYWYNNYLANGKVNLQDPSSGANITIRYSKLTTNPTGTFTPGDVYIGVGDQCNNTSLTAGQASGTASSKQFAMLVALEQSGVWYCTDNR